MTKFGLKLIDFAIFATFIMAIWGPETIKWIATGLYFMGVKKYYGNFGNGVVGSYITCRERVIQNFDWLKK